MRYCAISTMIVWYMQEVKGLKTFDELRIEFSEFLYRDYHITREEDYYRVVYDFEIPGLCEFHPTWQFPVLRKVDEQLLEQLVFQLGMVESISYYKCTCSKKVRVLCGGLTKEQIVWWKKLYFHGLGEFLYLNGIAVSMEDLVDITCEKEAPGVYHDTASYEGCLVPVGGGKDSVVSLCLLKDYGVTTYHINYGSAIKEVIDAFEEKQGDYYAKRTICPNLLKCNQEGYLNGHTPFSAIVAFSTVIAAYLSGKKYIALSNETSANESTVKDSTVNHQYSKSVEFENDFITYFKQVTDSDIHYFSLLRPWAEIQIAREFAKHEQFHSIFRSCNKGSKQGVWCCDCPKCLFVYIILSPFLSQQRLEEIFGENLLNKESLDKDFRELTGVLENKPFECVGTRSEVLASMKEFIEQGGRSLLTERYQEQILATALPLEPMLKGFNQEHNVPEEFVKLMEV